jgi:hypothetical protein
LVHIAFCRRRFERLSRGRRKRCDTTVILREFEGPTKGPRPMDGKLAAAIEAAYATFSKYQLNGALSVCRCPVCVDGETERLLLTTPLRSISSALLAQYTHSSHAWDDQVAGQFRYFLPRYFELIAQDDPPTLIAAETSLDRLSNADYVRNWPAQEAEAIDAFWLALFLDRLARPEEDWSARDYVVPAHSAIDQLLCMVARAGGTVAPLLEAWEQSSSRCAVLHLATLVEAANWPRRRLRSGFWVGPHDLPTVSASMCAIMEWLMRPATRARLEAAFLNEPHPNAAELLSQAEKTVAACRVLKVTPG